MAKKRLYEIIKEMSLDEMADYLCRTECDSVPCGYVCSVDCPNTFDNYRKMLLEEWEDHKPAVKAKTEPVRTSYKSAGATMARYIFEGKVNFCFNRPGSRDIVYSVRVDGPEDNPPIQEARKKIRERNCCLCGRESECDDAHKAMCKVSITRYKKLDDK